ncbi:MAG TPA: alanine--tRNA ligase [Candidatus Methylomirabilis sp.]|nr:alanine--tRNA ligase [Candidatus Methylomirabilis sp.]
MSGAELRETFLRYFEERGHARVRSSPLVPKDDPTLLFTNAGMVQFKDVFLGREQRPYTRATTVQKCVRAGGKHNDLENVGRTARHHTFFEMLGNFSFGDYFKREAIAYGWELLTVRLGLPQERLWATIFREDDEAFGLWREVTGIPADRIVRLGEKDNFWAMGDTGPCGPCSEIVIDQGPGVGCGRPTCDIACGCDRFLELWNLVFMQFDRAADGTMTPLPKPSIDTGAGLERIAAVLQGVQSNFDTDLLRPIIAQVEELTGKPYGADARDDVSMRVIADHARAVAFLVTDGVLPSNEGRGYVLRRILRRALRHARLLGIDGPFLGRVTGRVVDVMGDAYPELRQAQERVAREALAEEERFGHALRTAIPRLEEAITEAKAKRPEEQRIPGEQLFKLYDTYGLPRDLIEEIAQEHEIPADRLDWQGFEKKLRQAQELARTTGAAVFKAGSADLPAALRELGKTHPTVFLGYTSLAVEACILAILRDGQPVSAAGPGEQVEIVLDRTPFYGESGGQVADRGRLSTENAEAEVLDVQKPLPGLYVHTVRVRQGTLREKQTVRAAVDEDWRAEVVKNHTGTHLVHEALRRVLGDHVRQEGSLVARDRLRFDFRHFGPMTATELDRVEAMVNRHLWRNVPVLVEDDIPYEEALAREAKAFFAEKYADRVRLVAIPEFGAELCGGTHCQAIGEIGLFKIAGEAGVAAGIRRIEAVTGPGAYRYLRAEEEALQESAERLKAKPLDLPGRVEKLAETTRQLERDVQRLRAQVAGGLAQEALARAQAVDGVRVVTARADDLDTRGLRELGDQIRAKLTRGVIVLGAAGEGRVAWVAMVTPDLKGTVHAGHLVRAVARLTGGDGGGRPDLAEAGGKDPGQIEAALRAVEGIVRRMLRGENSP